MDISGEYLKVGLKIKTSLQSTVPKLATSTGRGFMKLWKDVSIAKVIKRAYKRGNEILLIKFSY